MNTSNLFSRGYSRSFFFSSRRRHTRLQGDWSSDVCSSDLETRADAPQATTLRAFMDGVVAHWQSRHAVEHFDYVQADEDFPILSDTALQQMEIGRASCRERV